MAAIKLCDYEGPERVTMDYVAPELMSTPQHKGTPSQDLWSLGVVVYVLSEQAFPLVPLKFCRCTDHNLQALLQQLLSTDPTQRPAASTIMQYTWLTESSAPLIS